MPDCLQNLLDSKDVLLADGAMGTSLFALGLETGGSPELWNVDHADRITGVHAGFIAAGSDIVLTNTFGANRYRLKLHGAEDRAAELNIAGAQAARRAADGAGRKVLVAGSMGPTGEIFQPVGSLSEEEGREAFAEQARALAEGGADLLWVETVSAAEEVRAAVAGCAPAGLPIVVTMTFDTQGRTMMGLTPEAAMELAHGLKPPLAAFGANCGIGPAQLVDSILSLSAAAVPGDIIVAKGNCGIPEYRDGAICYSGTPEIMAAYARLARDAGARVIGGCCGTSPEHVKAMAEALSAGGAGPRPSREDIEAVLGPVAVPAPGPKAERGGRRNRRRGGASAQSLPGTPPSDGSDDSRF
jgi:5-methyltetrahydrofolate--homocysteine methyltransferase